MLDFLSNLPLYAAAAAPKGEDKVVIFLVQMTLLVIAGRTLGELMQRIRQPAVMGQLLAGIILGPSVFGALWPSAQQSIFPLHSSGREMLSAVSELGVMLLLLLTGMETDLALVKRIRNSAAFTSAGGIVIPFICGYILGQFLPADVLPDPHRRWMTSLFLATALSISSVKIVAAVLREVDFLRRDLGQVILASSILDDTIGWIILAVIGGLAAHGTIDLGSVAFSVIGTALFLLICFTVGGSWVAKIIRWTNDNFVGEMPVISVILVIMMAMALLTSFIGVNTVLGAFVAGIMIGQSPILTKHIEEQLKGLIVALFMPIFFGVAGLSIDMRVLEDPRLAELTGVVIVIASIGKLGGCYIGSRMSRLTHAESLAVGFGMNARGSTEIILATIGLSLGVLNEELYTVIVLMAVVTTLAMPPLLRWSLSRVTIREDERARLATEVAEEKEVLPKIERLLVGIDTREGDDFVARLAGWLIGTRKLTATTINLAAPVAKKSTAAVGSAPSPSTVLTAATEEAIHTVVTQRKTVALPKSERPHPLDAAARSTSVQETPARELVSVLNPKARAHSMDDKFATSILNELKNGYGMIFLGTGSRETPSEFRDSVAKILAHYKGPAAILFGSNHPDGNHPPLTSIMVPTIGADYSRFGAEIAVAIAKGCGASITALHVSVPLRRDPSRQPAKLLRAGQVLVADIERLGQKAGVPVEPRAVRSWTKEGAILRQVELGKHQLVVIGTKTRAADELHFGTSAMALIEKSPCPVLVVKS